MHVSELKMAARMMPAASGAYLLGDGGYDANYLHAAAGAGQMQMVAPRRRPDKPLSRKPQRPERRRSVEMVEGPSPFGRALLQARDAIERYFGNLTSFHAGLGPLPAWVRTHRRVRVWTHAKLIINAVRIASRHAAAG